MAPRILLTYYEQKAKILARWLVRRVGYYYPYSRHEDAIIYASLQTGPLRVTYIGWEERSVIGIVELTTIMPL